MENVELSRAEFEVMQVLWKADRPLKIQEVMDRLKVGKWKYNTVGTLLLRMEEKNAVTSERISRTIYYTSVLNEEDYIKQQTKSFIKRLYNGSAKDLAVSLFKDEVMSEEDIAEIREMFDL